MQFGNSWLELPDTVKRHHQSFKAGDVLFHQGEMVSSVFHLESGRVQLIRHLEDGSSVVLHVARDGGTFAEASLFAQTYHCDAVAEVDSSVLMISKRDILSVIGASADGALALAKLLAFQVRDLRAKLEMRSIRSASERVLAWFRMQASGNPPTVVLDRNWTDISAEVGLSREVLYRTLPLLEKAR
jgi:CRP-like cAMP-binding protein